MAAASVLLAAACGDLTSSEEPTLAVEDLLILPLQEGSPTVAPITFHLPNERPWTRLLLHDDAFNTLYVELSAPAGSLLSLNDQALAADDSVAVTVQSRTGAYGLVLSPDGLEFSAARPTAAFAFARYGDLSVADGSTTYATRAEYAEALTLWFEITPGRWRRVSGSEFDGADGVTGRLAQPGTYVVAAPR